MMNMSETMNGVAHAAPSGEPWGPIDPFDSSKLPGFPVEALTPWHARWVTATSEFTQTPPDLAACVSLGVLSLAASRIVRVEVRKGWTVPTNLWFVSALPPGERKSPVYAAATHPLDEFCRVAAEQARPAIVQRASERRILEAQIRKVETAAAKAQGDDKTATLEALRLGAVLAEKPEIRAPRLVCADATPEALARVLAANDECVGQFSAEGTPFEILSGRYSTAPNIELHLHAHAGDAYRVDRIGRDSLTLTSPLVTVVMTVQPSVIEGLAARPTFRARGLLARYLYSLPTSALGWRRSDATPVPGDATAAYEAHVTKLLGAYRAGERDTVPLSPEAAARRCALEQALEPRFGPDGDLVPIADWANKLAGHVCRLAGVLHVTDMVTATASDKVTSIPLATFERAIGLGEYFLAHARGAFRAMGTDETYSLAKSIWERLMRQRVTTFTLRDAYRGANVTKQAGASAVALLVERNLVRPVVAPAVLDRGRPDSPLYEVNPEART